MTQNAKRFVVKSRGRNKYTLPNIEGVNCPDQTAYSIYDNNISNWYTGSLLHRLVAKARAEELNANEEKYRVELADREAAEQARRAALTPLEKDIEDAERTMIAKKSVVTYQRSDYIRRINQLAGSLEAYAGDIRTIANDYIHSVAKTDSGEEYDYPGRSLNVFRALSRELMFLQQSLGQEYLFNDSIRVKDAEDYYNEAKGQYEALVRVKDSLTPAE